MAIIRREDVCEIGGSCMDLKIRRFPGVSFMECDHVHITKNGEVLEAETYQ